MSTDLNPRLMAQHVEAGRKVQQLLHTFFLALIKKPCRQLLAKPTASQFPDGNHLHAVIINFLPLAITLPNKEGKSIYVYGFVHHNIFYEITNRCSYMQSILFHC